MGEWSKKIGEAGEDLMSFLFKEIMGYYSMVENESLECLKEKKHKRKEAKNDRKTHGIDGLLSYRNPLEDNVLDIIVASSKYTSKVYPTNPKIIFKEHIQDLAHTIECFRYSKLNSAIKKQFTNIDRTDITGIIVWPSNSSPLNYELIPHIANSQLDQELDFDRIIVIDNDRFNFLYDTLYMSKRIYSEDNVSIIYHNTSLNNITQKSTSYGKILPMQYMVSDIIPLRIENNGKIEIIIFCKNSFNAENLSQILSFTKTFDLLDSISETTIAFSDYNNLEHNEQIASQLFKYENYKLNENLFIKKFPSDFRNN